ncbi:hypothetical protein WDW37_01805 [Bdellovibrionota bacterium FG-1]
MKLISRFPFLVIFSLAVFAFASRTYAGGSTASKITGSYVSGFGISYHAPVDSVEQLPNGTPQLHLNNGFGVESMHDMLIGLPMATLHGYGNFSIQSGHAEYSFEDGKPESPITGSGIHLNTMSFEVGMGPRFRPFPYSFISPVADAGVLLGAIRIKYDDESMGAKVNGFPYAVICNSAYYGGFAELGLDLKLGSAGIEALYRGEYRRVWIQDTLPTHFASFFENNFILLVFIPI